MAYNEELRERISRLTEEVEHTQYKKMFGGVCHLVGGNMFAGVLGDELILRVGKRKPKSWWKRRISAFSTARENR